MKTLEDEKIALKCELARLREEHEKLGYQYEQAQKEIARLNGEIGFLQGKAVVEMFEKAYPKAEVTLKKDESGHDRMVRVRF